MFGIATQHIAGNGIQFVVVVYVLFMIQNSNKFIRSPYFIRS